MTPRPCSKCGAWPARQFMNAWLCVECAPAVPSPDPASTAAALRELAPALLRMHAARKAAVDG